jgi:hypothetical protein
MRWPAVATLRISLSSVIRKLLHVVHWFAAAIPESTRRIATKMKCLFRIFVPLGIAAASAIWCWFRVSDVEIADEAFWANVKTASGLGESRSLVRVAQQLPSTQAGFWLDELRDLQPGNTQDAAAAAVLLNAPRQHFFTEFLKPSPNADTFKALGFAAPLELDFDAVDREKQRFEDACSQRCLLFAEAAADREPDNPEWWRLYAILQFRLTDISLNLTPRTSDWKARLLLAESHDPDNGLYPLLIAGCCWQQSGTLEYHSATGETLPAISNHVLFEEGWDNFHLALSRPHITGPADDAQVAYEFLVSRGHTRFEAAGAASDLTLRGTLLFQRFRAFQWISAAFNQAKHNGDYERAIQIWRQATELADKILADVAVSAADPFTRMFRRIANYRIAELGEQHPELVADQERADSFEHRVASTIESEVSN